DRRSRFQIAQAIEAEAAQNATDGGRAQRQGMSNATSGPTLMAESSDLLDQGRRSRTVQTMGSRRTIIESGSAELKKTASPLGSSFGGNVKGSGSRPQPVARNNSLNQFISHNWSKSGILMDVHSIFPQR